MTHEEIIKKAYEVYPGPDVKRGTSVFANDWWREVEKLREAYIKGLTEQLESNLPSNLDEAAEKYLDDLFGKGKHEDFYVQLFKAGAEWMAGQGVTIKGVLYGGNLGIPDAIPKEFYSDREEEIIVQVRKK